MNFHKAAAYRAREHRKREERLELFAEALAEGYTVTAAAHAAGVCQQNGSKMLKDIRDRLGWQAV